VDLPLSGHVAHIWRDSRDNIADTADFTKMADYRTQGIR
jgi:hypothetical protein